MSGGFSGHQNWLPRRGPCLDRHGSGSPAPGPWRTRTTCPPDSATRSGLSNLIKAACGMCQICDNGTSCRGPARALCFRR
jgi:hypothetical protein